MKRQVSTVAQNGQTATEGFKLDLNVRWAVRNTAEDEEDDRRGSGHMQLLSGVRNLVKWRFMVLFSFTKTVPQSGTITIIIVILLISLTSSAPQSPTAFKI